MMKKLQIVSVTLEHKDDENSYLDRYGKRATNQPLGEWCFSVATGEIVEDEIVLASNIKTQFCGGFLIDLNHSASPSSWEQVDDDEIDECFERVKTTANGNEQGFLTRGVSNLFEHFDVRGWRDAYDRDKKVTCLSIVYCCLEMERVRAFQAGEFRYIGIIAKAEIVNPATGVHQVIRSHGCWGVESDSKESIAYYEKDELAKLKREMMALAGGFGERAIDFAIKKAKVAND